MEFGREYRMEGVWGCQAHGGLWVFKPHQQQVSESWNARVHGTFEVTRPSANKLCGRQGRYYQKAVKVRPRGV